MPTPTSPFAVVEDGPFVVALSSAILAARDVRTLPLDLPRLTVHERVFVCVDTFLTEAQAGGVGHFFWNECAELYPHVLVGLTEIGAHDLRTQVEHYVAHVFGGDVPPTAEARQLALEALDTDHDSDLERGVGALASGTSLLARWARAHHEALARP